MQETQITLEFLKTKYPVSPVAPWGDCIVVPGTEFNSDWEVSLGDQGFAVPTGEIQDLKLAIDTLQQAYDAFSSALVELKNEFYGIKSGVADLAGETVKLQAKVAELEKSLVKHKHVIGSGEAAIPLEAS